MEWSLLGRPWKIGPVDAWGRGLAESWGRRLAEAFPAKRGGGGTNSVDVSRPLQVWAQRTRAIRCFNCCFE